MQASSMKFLLFIPIFSTLCMYAQVQHDKNPFNKQGVFEQFKSEDSLQGLYINDSLLQIIADTIPIKTVGDNYSWRDIKLVNYFYDSLYLLRRVWFRDGQDGDYYFYFDDSMLRKAISVNRNQSQPQKYYFTPDDNWLTISEIEAMAEKESDKKDLFKALKIGKTFFENFKTFR